MHFLHLIAVEAEKAEEAIRAAEEAIERYGDGDVWDWYKLYEVFDGLAAISFADKPEEFKQALQDADRQHEERMRDCLDTLAGRPAESEWNREVANLLLRLLDEGPSSLEERSRIILGLALKEAGCWLLGNYRSASKYYDGVNHSTDTRGVRRRCQENPGSQWLVAMDLHN